MSSSRRGAAASGTAVCPRLVIAVIVPSEEPVCVAIADSGAAAAPPYLNPYTNISDVIDYANENYENLGHVTLRFGNPSKDVVFGGAIGLRETLFEPPRVGSMIEVAAA